MSRQPFWRSVYIAFRGLIEAGRAERNLRLQLIIAILVVCLAAVCRLTRNEWGLIVVCITLVISAELINTAIEAFVDLVQPELDESARRAKDFAAAAVLITSIGAVILGAIIFAPHLANSMFDANELSTDVTD